MSDIDVQKSERRLKKRFESVTTFPQTRSHHCYIPQSGNLMKMKVTSFSTDEKTVSVNLR